MTDRVGQQLGNYRLIRLLGAGGFAEVYLGEHVYLATQAAIKVVQTRLVEEEQKHFLDEARIVARLVHPHIVRVLEFGIEGEVPFLVMDYAPNGTLRQHLPKNMPLTPQTILPYLMQVASALQYAHEQHLIHRDVKPENMLLGRNDEVLLSDFGIALLTQSVRFASAQDVYGTATYMAPEQIQGKAQPASDQYALGVVLYEWLSGTLPFRGSFTELCSQHLFVASPPLHDKVPDIAPAIEAVVEKAMAKDPQNRYASVQDMATAFEEACQAEETTITGLAPTVRRPAAASVSNDGSLAPTQYERTLPPTVQSSVEDLSILRTEEAPAPTTAALPTSATPERRVISRRLVITAGAGLASLAVVGGVTWLILSEQHSASAPSPARFTLPPSPTTTPQTMGTELLTYRGHTDAVYGLAWSPNGQYIASGSADTTMRVWNISSGDTLYVYQGHTGLFNFVFAVGWASNGAQIASGGADKTVQLCNAATGNRTLSYSGHTDRVLAVAWSPDGQYIASGAADKTVQVWEAATGTLLNTYLGHNEAVYTLGWSPDGKYIASGSGDKTVQVWEARTGIGVYTYHGHTDIVYALAFSPDGKDIASAGADRAVQVWDAISGKAVYTYQGHTGLANVVSALAWSPDGKRIASGSTDKTVQVWDAASGKHAYVYQKHTGTVFVVEWSPDGSYIASGSADKTVQIWQAQ